MYLCKIDVSQPPLYKLNHLSYSLPTQLHGQVNLVGVCDILKLNHFSGYQCNLNCNLLIILLYIIIRVHSAFSLVASCVLLKYTCTYDVN